jgi:FKBP-type peptidyl-prolyl cis-trans isomerase SlyD
VPLIIIKKIEMVIENNKVVALKYELRANAKDGELVEKVDNTSPLQFIYGAGSMLKDFESNLGGLKVGDNFDFSILADNAYGLVNEEMVVDLPKDIFVVDGKVDDSLLVLGNTVPMRDQQGNHLNGKIVEINDSTVKMDFNHPLAGENLFFTGEILDIREATETELSHGHLHSENQGCGGGSCDCNSGCGCN